MSIGVRKTFQSFKKANWKEIIQRELFSKQHSTKRKALSIGIGVMIGILPIWGFQMIIAIAVALLFKLNKVLTVIASHISFPPFLPGILFLSFHAGRLWTKEPVKNIFDKAITFDTIRANFLQYLYGSLTLSVVLGTLAASISYIVLSYSKKAIKGRKPALQME